MEGERFFKKNIYMRLLENKIVLITGGGRGIGRVIARQFAQDGATVYVNDLQIGIWRNGLLNIQIDME